MNIKQKVRLKIKQINIDVYSNQILLKSMDYSNQDVNVQRFNARKYYSAKDIIKNYNVIINGKKVLWLNSWFKYKATRRN